MDHGHYRGAPRAGAAPAREVGLDYEDVTIPSTDGVPLEGWFIPANSNRLVTHNRFLPGNRYGYPGHLPESGGLGGFKVSFLPEYKALHDAGYNVLAYDIRNFGLSGRATAGSPASGCWSTATSSAPSGTPLPGLTPRT